MALYSATKHAVAGYSESLDHELRTMGVRVSVVEPACINTPFDANLMKPDAPLAAHREVRAGESFCLTRSGRTLVAASHDAPCTVVALERPVALALTLPERLRRILFPVSATPSNPTAPAHRPVDVRFAAPRTLAHSQEPRARAN